MSQILKETKEYTIKSHRAGNGDCIVSLDGIDGTKIHAYFTTKQQKKFDKVEYMEYMYKKKNR